MIKWLEWLVLNTNVTLTFVTQVNLGAEVQLKQSKLMSCVDQSGRFKTSLESLLFGPFKFMLSAEMHHQTDDYKFGIGVNSG